MARKKTKALKEDEEDYISHLPHNVVTDILTRLPFKTLFNCRFVCKTWLHLLKDPSFTQLYHTRVNSNWTILQPKVKDNHLYAVHLYNNSSVIHSSARVRFATKTHLGFGYYVKHHLVDSCNGLILVGEVHQYKYHVSEKLDQLFVCNPITGEFIIIRPDVNLTPSLWCPRLGFCPKTQVYIRWFSCPNIMELRKVNECQLVYTLGVKGNNFWKRVNVGDDVYGETTGSVFLNGIIHWVVTSHSVPQYIYSFDVEDEGFQSVPLPLEVESPEPTKLGISLGVLEGCLAICEKS